MVATFRRSPPNTACLQCRLNYYNASENWLTRMFTLDYALWFDQVLPGLERLGMPIPLGGTSNHFRIDVLRELHAWDPFNVTEDADLGIRIGQKGYRVGVVEFDHVRGSELPGRPMDPPALALDQRLHADAAWSTPGGRCTLIRTAGLLGFLGFIFFIGGTVLAGLLNPLFWLFYLIWLVASSGELRSDVSAIPAVPVSVQSARRQWRLHLSDHAGADPARLARSHSVQLHAVRLLGADLARRL